MSTVLKKGAPSRSYTSRQRKLGPAPFASFEDLSDELESPADSQQGTDPNKMEVLPEIKEDIPHSPFPGEHDVEGGENYAEDGTRSHKPVTATSSASTVTFAPSHSVPTSGPTSGLQTPSTPRIDISCASSSTPPSEDSASEKELFQGGLGFAFHEEGTEELRSSTEELDLGEVEIDSEEERRQKRAAAEEDIYRRSSHPANIFSRRKSSNVVPPLVDDDDVGRKPSAHSLFLDGLLSRPNCRHASFGSGDYHRPGAISSLSAHSSGSMRGRSPSPHKMMLETSFCGNKPIPTKSMDMDSPPKDTDDILNINVNVKETGERRVKVPSVNLNIKSSITEPSSPRSPRSPRDFDRRRSSGRRSVSPFKMVYETSFCGNKPIPTRSMEQDSPPKEIDQTLGAFLAQTTLTTVQVHQQSNINVTQTPSPTTPEPDYDRKSLRATSPESPKSSDHWRPLSPRIGTPSPASTTTTGENSSKSINIGNLKHHDTNIFKWPEPASSSSTSTSTSTPKTVVKNKPDEPKPKQNSQLNSTNSSKNSKSARDLNLENDERTTELKISEDPVVTVEDAMPLESKGLFLMNDNDADSFEGDEDGDLPYVPTTLPQEKSTVTPIFPSKERRSMSVTTTPVQRPKVNRPANPASLHDYIAYSATTGGSNRKKDDESKMKINLPREDSLTDSSNPAGFKSPKKKNTNATSWADFTELGLRSPREIRRKLKEENGAFDDIGSYHSDSSEAVGGPVNGSDDEADALLKLPKVPFAIDLDVRSTTSNRSSIHSQEEVHHSPGSPSVSSLPLESSEDSTKNQQD